MDPIKTRVVTHSRRIMAETGLTQRGLARDSDLSYGTLRRFLGGRDEGVKSTTIVALARALDVSIDDLLAPLS